MELITITDCTGASNQFEPMPEVGQSGGGPTGSGVELSVPCTALHWRSPRLNPCLKLASQLGGQQAMLLSVLH